MENKYSTELEPLPDNCLKLVLEHMELEKREKLQYLFPIVRSTLPYNLKSLTISDNYLEVNKREWTMGPLMKLIEERPNHEEGDLYEAVPNRTNVRFEMKGYRFIHEIDQDPGVAFNMLIDEYLKNGTKIKKFKLYSCPQVIKDRDPETFKLSVEEVQCRNTTYGAFKDFLPFLDQSKPLKKIGFTFRNSNREFFDEPMVLKSEEIFLQFPYYDPDPMEDILCTLPNKHILMTYLDLPIVKIRELAAYWKKVRKPIGHTYSVVIENYIYVVEVFDDFKEHLGAIPSKRPEFKDNFFAHCATIEIDEHSEIVVYGERAPIHWPPLIWALKMEVMPRGATITK